MADLRARMEVVGDDALGRGTSEVIVYMDDGVVYREFDNRSVPDADLDEQGRRLETKFKALAAPVIGAGRASEVVERVADLESLDDVNSLTALCH